MTTKARKFEDLTKPQQKAIKEAGRKFVIGALFNGINYGGLIVLTNLVLILLKLMFFNDSMAFLFISCVLADIILLNMMFSVNTQKATAFKEEVKKILDAE